MTDIRGRPQAALTQINGQSAGAVVSLTLQMIAVRNPSLLLPRIRLIGGQPLDPAPVPMVRCVGRPENGPPKVGLQRQLMNSTGVPVRTSLVSGGVHLLGVGRKQDERLETAAAFPAVPNMTGAPIAPVLGPFGGDQLITALNAFHPEAGTTTGNARPHHRLRASAFT